jgi:rubrerythrin
MTISQEEMREIICTSLEMKERKRALYEDAMNSCPDQVGKETFRILRDAEVEHTRHIQDAYEELKKGKSWEDVCKIYPERADMRTVFRRIAEEHGKAAHACGDEIFALETGLKLEETCMRYFQEHMKRSTDAQEREFLERMAIEEREHYVMLADLKFYYSDPQAWFMEKSRARLDGAGGSA